jgi:ABC-type transport system involved in multi-copper enzyme maturation permease subunit
MLALWQAETLKLLSRTSARFGLVVAALISVAIPLILYWWSGAGVEVDAAGISSSAGINAPKGLVWSLYIRNFYILHAFIIMLGALSFAGEYKAKTLREDLVRPVPRWSVLLAKWWALSAWIGLTLILAWGISSVLGLILFGTEGNWQDPALAYLVTWLCDVGFTALVLAIAVILRSVAATIVASFLFIVFDMCLGVGLTLMQWISQMAEVPWAIEFAIQAKPWLPSSAFGVWLSFAGGEPWVWQNFAALGAVAGGSAIIATVVFEWIDLP